MNCEKCWDTPCTCGFEYESWDVTRLNKQINMLIKVASAKGFELNLHRDNIKLTGMLAIAEKALRHVNMPTNAHFLTLSCRTTVQESLSQIAELKSKMEK